MLAAMSTPPKTTYTVTVQAADGTERSVSIKARDEQQVYTEAGPHFEKRGEKIIRVERAGAQPVAASPSGDATPVPSSPPQQQAPPGGWPAANIPPYWGGPPQVDHRDLLIELRKNNELLDGLRMDLRGKVSTRRGIVLDVAAGVFLGGVAVLIGMAILDSTLAAASV